MNEEQRRASPSSSQMRPEFVSYIARVHNRLCFGVTRDLCKARYKLRQTYKLKPAIVALERLPDSGSARAIVRRWRSLARHTQKHRYVGTDVLWKAIDDEAYENARRYEKHIAEPKPLCRLAWRTVARKYPWLMAEAKAICGDAYEDGFMFYPPLRAAWRDELRGIYGSIGLEWKEMHKSRHNRRYMHRINPSWKQEAWEHRFIAGTLTWDDFFGIRPRR